MREISKKQQGEEGGDEDNSPRVGFGKRSGNGSPRMAVGGGDSMETASLTSGGFTNNSKYSKLAEQEQGLCRLRSDGSNSEIPVLTPSQMDSLMKIFGKLEDPDALQGVQVR